MDIVKQLLKPINEKEDYFISQWPNEEPNVHDAVRFNAAKEIERLREALQEIADAKISGVVGDGYNVRDWLIKHHVMLVDKARAALKEGE